jgi:hypothetical protein
MTAPARPLETNTLAKYPEVVIARHKIVAAEEVLMTIPPVRRVCQREELLVVM